MATQAITETGAVYSRGGYARQAALRPATPVGTSPALGTLLRDGALRPIGMSVVVLGRGGFQRQGAQRALSPALVLFASGGILSLENLRLLSPPLAAYAAGRLLRTAPLRAIAPGYVLTLPPPELPPVDSTAPVVGNFSPTAGTPIAKTTPVSFDVTEESGDFQRIFVIAFFPSTGLTEVIHDGDGFRGFYAATSSRSAIAGGFRYTVLRSGGWPAAPTIQTFAADRAGNEAN